MYNKQWFLFLLIFISQVAFSQEKPKIDYALSPKVYEIAAISITGADSYENSIIIGFSELSVGQKITVPGDNISNAIKRFWKQGLFSDVKISAEKIEGDKIWLNIDLKQSPKISEIRYSGAKKSAIEDLEVILGLTKGGQLTPNLVNQSKAKILNYYEDKGYQNATATITQIPDVTQQNSVIVQIDIDRKTKIKVHRITLEGNNHLLSRKIKHVMKKTNESGKILNIFRTKKFVKPLYEADKVAAIEKYNEIGYRDAYIERDTVTKVPSYKILRVKKDTKEPKSLKNLFSFKRLCIRLGKHDKSNLIYKYDTISRYSDKKVDIYIKFNEGKKYFFRNIKWVGNTLYSSDFLNQVLRIKKGDVYNSKLLNDRLMTDDDAVSNLYQDNGYLFFNIDPVEVTIDGDSIDFEMRMYEGRQAVINKVGISGNTRVYEHVVRRELRTKPGQLYNKSDIIRTLRELAQMGQFDPEKIVPDIQPNPDDGTVDINYKLESKASDQVELSAGYGATGITGSLGLTFKNFAIENIFKPKTYKIVPQGEGQTFGIKGTTNGSYYTSFSATYTDPWFGKKRPNSLSLSAYYSRQSGVSSRYSSSTTTSYYSSVYGTTYAYEVDPEKYIHTFGTTLGWGARLRWPDDYFMFNADLTYQHYSLMNWSYFVMTDGKANNLNLGLTLSRNSIDNPIYTRKGSTFSLSLQLTPPYSLISGKDYSDATNEVKYAWIEYHKWKFKTKVFTPLSSNQKLVLMTRAEYGFLGYYNADRKSPFETFLVGGDGMSGTTSYSTDIVGLRGYSSGSLTPLTTAGGYNGNVYTRLSMELHFPIVLETSTTIYALAFLEGGNCWSTFQEFNPFTLKRSAGVGVRLYLPMFGLMGVDWGYGFDKVKNVTTYGGSQFAFTIGQEF